MKPLYKILIISVACFLNAGLLYAQKNLNEGNKYFDRNMFEEAIPYYLKELDRGKNYKAKNEAREKLASCYRLTGRFLEANEMYKKVLDRAGRYHKPEHVLNYANSLKSSALYAEAAEQFKKYMQMKPEDPMGEIYLKSCTMAQEWLIEEEEYFVMNFERINTEESEFGPSYYDGGIVFTSERKDSKKKFINFSTLGNELRTDLYYFDLNNLYDEEYMTENFEVVNSFLHDGAAAFSEDGQTVFFTRTVMGDKNKKTNVVLNSLQIYTSQKQKDGTWSEPRSAFPFNSEEYSVGQPSISPDGERVYFISDMPGGYGKTDIYYTERQDNGEWGPPINLGEPVNTFGHELFPFIQSEDTLFFSSDTHPGMGKLDIFRATRGEIRWDSVENMKTPINSIGDDFGIVMNRSQTRGFFSSDRFNGMGKEDIFTLYKDEPLKITFEGNEIKIPDHSLYSGITYKLSKENDDVSEALNSEFGYYRTELMEDTVYNLTLRKNGFFYDVVKMKLNALSDEENFKIEITPRNTPVLLTGMVAEKEMKITKRPPPAVKKEKENKVGESAFDTVIIYKAIPHADVILASNKNPITKTTTGDDGKFRFENELKGGKVYEITGSLSEELAEKRKEEEKEPEEEPEEEVEEEVEEEMITEEEPQDTIKEKVEEEEFLAEEEEIAVEEENPVEEESLVVEEPTSDTVFEIEPAEKELMAEEEIPVEEELFLDLGNEEEEDPVIIEEISISDSALRKESLIAEEDLLNLSGKIVDEKEEAVAGGNVKIYDGNDLLGDTETDREGEFDVDVPEKEKYLMSVTKEGFFQEQVEITKEESLSGEALKVDLKPIEVNKTIKIKNIFFDYNKYDLRPESLVELDRLTDFLKVNPDIKIELNAHTDSRGGYYFNLVLSHNRAEAVKSYLKLSGIDPSRILVRGFGESFPDYPDAKTEAQHARNRRVEFRVVEYGDQGGVTPMAMMNSRGYMILDECPYSSRKPFPSTNDIPMGIVYRVKIGEYRNALSNDAFKGLFPVIRARDYENATWEYYAGLFDNLEDAEIAVEMIKRDICHDAYITAFYNRERVTIEEALRIAERKGNEDRAAEKAAEKAFLAQNQPSACFSIQIGAYKRNLRNNTMQEFRELAGKHELISTKDKGVTYYSIGRFYTYEEAFKMKMNLKNDKYTNDAFIIAIQNGEKISIGQARNYLKKFNSAMR